MTNARNGTALVLAAHGSATDSTVHELVNGYADRLAHLPPFDEVSAAFHLGEPSFSTVLDQLRADRVIVVPLMTSRGYFCETVLPAELARNRRCQEMNLVITDPVGTHEKMGDLVSRRVADRMAEHNFDPTTTAVVIVGHGTPRHAQSAESTTRLVEELRTRHPTCEVSAGFLDCDPMIESALTGTQRPFVIVEPFLIADGLHASRDIPRRLGMAALDGASPPIAQRVGHRTVVCDSAVGADPGILDLIAELAVRSLPRFRRCGSEKRKKTSRRLIADG